MEKVMCKMCEGQGTYMDGYDDMYGNTVEFENTCFECEGEGQVVPMTPEEEAAMAEKIRAIVHGETECKTCADMGTVLGLDESGEDFVEVLCPDCTEAEWV